MHDGIVPGLEGSPFDGSKRGPQPHKLVLPPSLDGLQYTDLEVPSKPGRNKGYLVPLPCGLVLGFRSDGLLIRIGTPRDGRQMACSRASIVELAESVETRLNDAGQNRIELEGRLSGALVRIGNLEHTCRELDSTIRMLRELVPQVDRQGKPHSHAGGPAVATSEESFLEPNRMEPDVPHQKPNGDPDVVRDEVRPQGQHPELPGQMYLGGLDKARKQE